MRISFNPGDAKSLSKFFRADLDFLDMFIRRDKVSLISDSPEIFAQMDLDVLSCTDYVKPVVIRVERKYFLSMVDQGVVSVYVSESGKVEITFRYNSGTVYNMYSELQHSYLSSLTSRQAVLEAYERYNEIDLEELRPALRIFRNMTNTLLVRDGVISTELSGVHMYYKVKCPNMCVGTNAIGYLLGNSDRHFFYQDYIIGQTDRTMIIIRQQRSDSVPDLDIASKSKSSHRFKLSMGDVCSLIKTCKLDGKVRMNFEEGVASIEKTTGASASFSTSFKVEDVESTNALRVAKLAPTDVLDSFNFDFNDSAVPLTHSVHNIPSLYIPTEILEKVLEPVGRSKLRVEIKKSFIQFTAEAGKYIIMIGREDVRD